MGVAGGVVGGTVGDDVPGTVVGGTVGVPVGGTVVVGGTVCMGAVVPGWINAPELGGVLVPLSGGVTTTDEEGVLTVGFSNVLPPGISICGATTQPASITITSSQLVIMPNSFFLFMGFPLSRVFILYIYSIITVANSKEEPLLCIKQPLILRAAAVCSL